MSSHVCRLRDGLSGSAPGSRRPCEACSLLDPPVRSTRDPGPPTLGDFVQGTSGLHAELRRLAGLVNVARDLCEKWGRNTVEGVHAGQVATILRLELAHWNERLPMWRRRLVRHPEMGAKPVTAKCPCQRDCLLMGDVATVVPMDRTVGEDDGDEAY